MSYKPRFNYTTEIISALSRIEYLRGIIVSKTLPLHISVNLKNQAKLKSTHYSTVIEGNKLSIEEVKKVVKSRPGENESRYAQEVRNYWRSLTFLRKANSPGLIITGDFIKRLHRIIEVRGPGRRGKLSEYRGPTRPGYLFCVRDDVTGKIDYIPPSYEDVPKLMSSLVEWISAEKSLPIPIKAAITAYQLVTIHAFDDGNGRLARALALYILMLNGYDLNGCFSVEEYYANNLQLYYDSLQMGLPVNYYDGRNDPDLTLWVEFFLKTMVEAFESITASTLRLHEATHGKLLELSRKEVKLLQLALRFEGKPLSLELMATWFEVTKRTMQDWVKDWVAIGLLEPASGAKRITSYKLGTRYKDLKLEDIGIS